MHNLNSIREHWIRLLMGQPYLPHWPLALNWIALAVSIWSLFPIACGEQHPLLASKLHPALIYRLSRLAVRCFFILRSLSLSLSLIPTLKSMPSSHKHSANSCLSCLWSWPRTELREAGLWISIPAAVPRTHASPRAISVPRVTPYQMLPSSYPSPHPLGITTTSVHRN